MKRLLSAAILTGAMALQIGATGADHGDKVLVAKAFTPTEEAGFNANDNTVSAVWNTWGDSDVDDIVSFEHQVVNGGGAANGLVTIKAGASNKGLYLYFEVSDNNFVAPPAQTTEPLLWFDATDLWFDSKSSLKINNLNQTNQQDNEIWTGNARAQFKSAITHTSKQIGVALGSSKILETIFFGQYSTTSYKFVAYDEDLEILQTTKNLSYKLITDGSKKISEFFIPWSLLGVTEQTLNDETNKRMFGFCGGYNDNDDGTVGQAAAVKMRWNGGDPFSDKADDLEVRSSIALKSWGDIEVPVGIVPEEVVGIKSNPSLKKSAFAGSVSAIEYFTLSGKKIAPHNLNKFLNTTVIERQIFTNGQSIVNKVPLK